MQIVCSENGFWYVVNSEGENISPDFETELEAWKWMDENTDELPEDHGF